MTWDAMGIGMLINTTNGLEMRGQGLSTLSQSGYPMSAYKNFNRLQTQHLGEREALLDDLRKCFGDLKENFFKTHHFETELEGKEQLRIRTGPDGKPIVKVGPETPQQAEAREYFESAQRLRIYNKHESQLEQLSQQESAKARSFLAEHASLLREAGVQQELQKMIVDGKKMAMKLQQEHDLERWSADMPPTKEIQEAVIAGLKDIRRMEARHVADEELSSDHEKLLEFERKIVSGASRVQKPFLKDPSKMRRQAKLGPPRKRLDELLPSYLVTSLRQLGVYEP